MSNYKSIPISAAKVIAEKYEKAQVLIFAWDEKHGMTHITTYGITKQHCRMAAQGGKRVAEMLGLTEQQTLTETPE